MAEPSACPACQGADAPAVFEKMGLPYRRCADCGLLFARPGTSRISYEDPQYFKALGLETKDPELRALKEATASRRLADLVAAGAGAPMLEIGCGTGHFLEAARDRKPVGVDISRTALALARARASRLAQASPAKLPFADGLFATIALYDTLEHLLDPREALGEAARVLKSGGLLHLTTPDIDGMPARFFGKRFPHVNPEHVCLFGRRSLARILDAAGFQVRTLGTVRKPLSIAYLRSRLDLYRTPVLTPLARAICAIAPGFASRPMLLPSGELAALATKRSAGRG